MFEIIMYLFENHIQVLSTPDSPMLLDRLQSVGFHETEIQKAFAWFAELGKAQTTADFCRKQSHNKYRYFSLEEKQKLGRGCLGLLLYLEQIYVITPELREKIIDRAMAIEDNRIEIEQLKWIILMVLFHELHKQPKVNASLTWIETLLFTKLNHETLH